jgi:WXG100 family type VII secretion target
VADGPRTFDEFKVDLKQLHDAIGSVKREHNAISAAMSAVGSEFNAVKDAWGTPSTASFDDVQAWFVKASSDLEDLLEDMTNRLQTAYTNYKHAEETNVQNNTPQGGNPPPQHNGGNHGANRTVVTNHGNQQPTATLREGMMPAQPTDRSAATLRDAVTSLTDRVASTPANFE